MMYVLLLEEIHPTVVTCTTVKMKFPHTFAIDLLSTADAKVTI